MSETAIVHPWTRKWWMTLPSVYRSADAKQYAPPGTFSVGLNQDPIFLNGSGGWVVTALTQDADKIAATLSQTFVGVPQNQSLTVQVWWSTPVPGAYLTISVYGQSPAPLATTTIDGFTEDSGLEALTIRTTPSSGGALTVRLELGGNVTDDNSLSLLTIDGVNVGYRPVQYDALPGVIAELAYPLLRFMDGPGRAAGLMRDISDRAWFGSLTDPATAPDAAIPWLAQMLGTPTTQRALPVPALRAYLQDMADDGRPAAGTRQSIITAAKQYLLGEGQAMIPPTTATTPAHTIVMFVRSDQVPDGDLTGLVAKIRATGTIPAGHILTARMANSEWDSWEAAAGETWDEVQAKAKTWAQADSLGVVLADP